MSSSEQPWPIWDDLPHMRSIPKEGQQLGTNRTGGPFLLMPSGAAFLQDLNERQKINLSYWIYHHNLQYRMINMFAKFEENPKWGEYLLELDQAWVVDHRDLTPSASDRMLMFLRELIRSDDSGLEPTADLQLAAGGCRNDQDLEELIKHARKRGWTSPGRFRSMGSGITDGEVLELSGRIHVEEQLGVLGRGRQGFVAMWFDPSMDDAYKCGIKPAIKNAGYQPRLIKEKDYLGGVVDEIMAEIRKSRFVVADFTSSPEAGARGGVYFEAGFAYGLDIPVFLTCRKGCQEGVHFDIGHLNRLEWETPEDLRKQLQDCIEAVLGPGPLDPPRQQPAA